MSTSVTQFGLAAGFSALGMNQTNKDIKSSISSSMYSLTSALTIRNTQRTIFESQGKEIDERLGYQLTTVDLNTVKAKARLRAAQAETGTSGGTSDLAVAQAYTIGARNREATIMSARDSKLEVARRNIMNRLESDNRVNSAIQDIPSPDEITAKMMNTAIEGAKMGWTFGESINSAYDEYSEKSELVRQNEALTATLANEDWNKYNGIGRKLRATLANKDNGMVKK
jgi:hypothetical protein